MSNYTRTTRTITETEYSRLTRQAREAASLSSQVSAMARINSSLDDRVRSLDRRIEAAAREARDNRAAIQAANAANAAKHEALRSELRNVIANTDARFEAARKETVQAMDNMREEFNTNLVNAIESNNRNIEAAMNHNNEILNGRINALHNEVTTSMAAVNSRIDNIVAADNDLLGQAQEYREQTQVLQDMIGRTRHELLIPGGYQSVLDAVNQAERDIQVAEGNHANSPVARNNARLAFEAAVRFYESVQVAESEWQMQLAVTEQLAEVVATQLDNSRTIEPKPGKEFDVDHWTYGDLSSQEATLEGLRDRVDNPDNLSRDDLINIQAALRNVSENVDNTYNNAYVAIITSQNVAEEAEALRAELAATGAFTVTEHAYEGEDQRGNYRYILRNPSGLTVVVTVTVNRGNEVSIETEADIIDYGNMAMEDAENLVNGVVERLTGETSAAWNRGEVQCHNRGGVVCHPERGDMNAWRHSSKPKPANSGNTGNADANRNVRVSK